MKKWIAVGFMMMLLVMSACNASENSGNVQQPAANQDVDKPGGGDPETGNEDLVPDDGASPGQESLEIIFLEDGVGLNSPGPWMIFPSAIGLIAVSADGSEAASLGFPLNDRVVSWEISPKGGVIASVREDFDSLPGNGHKWLEVRAYPANELLFTQELMDYSGEPLSFQNESEQIDFVQDRHAAIGPVAWSHDGKTLAYIGSHEGPSPDVYAYQLGTSEALQLTSGPSHAVNLNWSPDDAYIFHAGVEKMYVGYSGAGYAGWSFYAAAPDGSEVLDVYQGADDIQQEFILGWLSDRDILMASGQWFCGMFDLRAVNIETGARTAIYRGQHNYSAYSPENNKALIWIWSEQTDTDECGPAGEPGLYLLSVPDGDVHPVEGYADLNISSIEWDETGGVFLADGGETWLVVEQDGRALEFPQKPTYSPDGQWVAYVDNEGDFFTVYDVEKDMPYEIVHAGKILHPVWTPDSSRLFYFQEGEEDYDLFLMALPGLNSTLIVENVMDRYSPEPVWLMP